MRFVGTVVAVAPFESHADLSSHARLPVMMRQSRGSEEAQEEDDIRPEKRVCWDRDGLVRIRPVLSIEFIQERAERAPSARSVSDRQSRRGISQLGTQSIADALLRYPAGGPTALVDEATELRQLNRWRPGNRLW